MTSEKDINKLEKIHKMNRNKLLKYKNKNNLDIKEILYQKSRKIVEDLILEGFIPCEIRCMLEELLKSYFNDNEKDII